MDGTAVLYFPTLPHKRYNFRKKVFEHNFLKICLQILYETFIILRRIQRNGITNVLRALCEMPIILVCF
jgi:hypothetical protein